MVRQSYAQTGSSCKYGNDGDEGAHAQTHELVVGLVGLDEGSQRLHCCYCHTPQALISSLILGVLPLLYNSPFLYQLSSSSTVVSR